jgi:hypothetical protein
VRPPGGLARAVPLADPEGVRTEPRALRQPFSERALAEATAAGRRPGEAAVARVEPAPVAVPEPIVAPKSEVSADPAVISWTWPTSGALIERFSDTNRGIDIGGKAGQPILASADGRVVYSGSAIRGYGRMLIVKHNDQYVSVYAHAAELLVKEGQVVNRGQRIAEMGSTDADRVKLHFEIRRLGKPVDPARLLPGVRSVVALAVAHAAGEDPGAAPGRASVARYARGRDYHAVLKRKLKDLRARLAARDPSARPRNWRFLPEAIIPQPRGGGRSQASARGEPLFSGGE